METTQIDPVAVERLRIPIIGTSPLIVHRFGEKAKRMMLDAMQGRKVAKVAKDPEAEYEASFYRLKDGGYGFPASGFKQATVGAARYFGKAVTMTSLKQWIFIHGEPGDDGRGLCRLEGEPSMREDCVKLGQSGADLRYRPQFEEWRTWLDVVYTTSSLSRGSLLSLIDAGGMGVGVGEWRPERDGDFGTFRIDDTRDIEMTR